jgi:hypothetical protein
MALVLLLGCSTAQAAGFFRMVDIATLVDSCNLTLGQ